MTAPASARQGPKRLRVLHILPAQPPSRGDHGEQTVDTSAIAPRAFESKLPLRNATFFHALHRRAAAALGCHLAKVTLERMS